MLQHHSQCSGEWFPVRRGHMLWRNPLIRPRLPCRKSYTCSSRPRMVSDMLVRREETDYEVCFWVSEGWLYSAHMSLDRSQLNCCASLHFRLWERPLTLLREHLLPDNDSGNTRPVAIAVSDDMCLGKLGPTLWLSFLHLYHVYQDQRYGLGTLVMSCLGMVAYISVYVLFIQYWRRSWDVLWDWCSFSQTVNLHWVSGWLEEVHKPSCFRVLSVIPEESCRTCLRTS